MNVNTAIKNIKAELNIVKAENKKFNNADVEREIKNVESGLKDLKKYIDLMLDMDNVGSCDYRSSMITSVNFCYKFLAEANFCFWRNSGSLYLDNEEYNNAKTHYEAEEERLNGIQI